MRHLASIQKIDKLEPIEGADFIKKARVLGWILVVKKDEFQEGDLCVYFEIDSLLPQHPQFDFINMGTTYQIKCLSCTAVTLGQKNSDTCPNCQSKQIELHEGIELRKDNSRKLSTKKLRGVISQGLAMPLATILKVLNDLRPQDAPLGGFAMEDLTLGQDLTELLGVIKYEPPLELRRTGNIKGKFPFYVPKTDETRIQSIPEILDEIRGKRCYVSVKIDGTSGTFVHKDGEIDVCSRNLSIRNSSVEGGISPADDYYWAVAKKYGIVEKLRQYGNIALQGEICGPGIQKNRLKLPEISLFLFDAYLIDEQKYADLALLRQIAEQFGIPLVPILDDNFVPDASTSVESLLKMAEGHYKNTRNEREGIVIRLIEPSPSVVLQGRISFKIISNRFLLKGGD
jgi:RNA ligase (TIGR02306 family)